MSSANIINLIKGLIIFIGVSWRRTRHVKRHRFFSSLLLLKKEEEMMEEWRLGKLLSQRPTVILKEPIVKALMEETKGCVACETWARLIRGRWKT